MSVRTITRAPVRIGSTKSNIKDVISSDQIYTCSCDNVSPNHFIFCIVPKILIEVKLDDKPLLDNPYMIKLIPKDVKLISVVLSGGYNVQPIPFPYSLNSDEINKPYDKGITNKDILLTLGYPTSGEPINIGM